MFRQFSKHTPSSTSSTIQYITVEILCGFTVSPQFQVALWASSCSSHHAIYDCHTSLDLPFKAHALCLLGLSQLQPIAAAVLIVCSMVQLSPKCHGLNSATLQLHQQSLLETLTSQHGAKPQLPSMTPSIPEPWLQLRLHHNNVIFRPVFQKCSPEVPAYQA